MDWDAHKHDWPMADASRFVTCKPHRWHVQEMGKGPLILLLHGAGGATQSFRHLMPLLTANARVVAIDLPGQGFTQSGAKHRHGLSAMSEDIWHLCAQEGWEPDALIGHSAGGAIALEMTRQNPRPVIGINAALGQFKGLAGLAFPVMAKTLSVLPGVAQLFAASTTREGAVTRLIEGTGSKLTETDLRWYRALISDRNHVDATLAMMAQWDLNPLLSALPDHQSEVLLIAAQNDKTVPAETSRNAASKLPNGRLSMLPKLGHLAHEEDAATVFAEIHAFLENQNVIPT